MIIEAVLRTTVAFDSGKTSLDKVIEVLNELTGVETNFETGIVEIAPFEPAKLYGTI